MSTERKRRRVTAFQAKVYSAVRQIPAGKVSTYAAVAEATGCKSPRAVGQALKVNPFAPDVPCHRVISSSLKIGGFQGQTTGSSISRKIQMLKDEGVVFDAAGRLIDTTKIFIKGNYRITR